MSLQFIYKNKIGQNLAWNETTTFEEIAKESKLGLDDTTRMMRLAMANYLFAEPQPGVVAHTAASHAIVSNPLLNAWIGVTVEENWPPMLRLNEAMQKWPDSEEPLQSAYCLAHGMNEMPFDVWERDPARVQRFASAMNFLHSDSGFQPQFMVDGYDFGSLGEALFVDVGGSTGHVSIMLAQKYPNITCIVQDLPATVKAGKEQLPKELEERVSFMSHDFWTEQPVKGADIYYFRWVFHDWSDSLSVKLLRQLIPALKPGARVLINDICIPPAGVMNSYQEQRIRSLDILMKTFTNAKERSAKEWAALFAKADPGFKFNRVHLPAGAKIAIIEAKWNPVE
ncbi:putative hydroxyindole O-methyltransferase [Byssothecium circinans]|uniref:Putative hydroxyindole O-methyltransferase n=1 Tax=Byssothecium circinans TaxID=147558 RepID=A0A6A5TEH3_9PLEO|nr:putative hydroxyindole O-methyltransferase [Byssothecium circinans]